MITPVKASQSKVLRGDNNFRASNAIDNNLKTDATSVVVDGEVWFKLELGKTYFIDKVIVHTIFYNTDWPATEYASSWCNKRLANYRYCKDGHTNVDVSVYKGEKRQKSCGTIEMTYGLEQSDQIYTVSCGWNSVMGDIIKLSKSKGEISIVEIIVLSGPGQKSCHQPVKSKLNTLEIIKNPFVLFCTKIPKPILYLYPRSRATDSVTQRSNLAKFYAVTYHSNLP